MKVCTKCKIEKSFDEFSNNKNNNDGKQYSCKECVKEISRQYYLKNQECLIQKSKQYREDNPDKVSEVKHLWYENNKEHCSEKGELYRLDNSEHILEVNQKWRKDNPDKVAAIGHTQKAKRRGWGSPIILNEYFENSHCHHLQSINSETGEIDHRTCLYVPIELHTSVHHDNTNRKTMLAINELVFEWLLTQV